ncbi:sulfotransferase family protein [Hippea alviniae]|uniref:sulfotransferase family protein n=1 Tax=Hippea alviniae TaxID=1279027 RepID=UPI0003B7810A|nr:sulfotransferase [Hippea alviniae]
MNTRLPNFLIVGAAKAGTTSLYYYLREHPEIYLSDIKELRFFSNMEGNFQGPGDENVNKSVSKSIDEYESFFEKINGEKAIGDISPDYLYYFKNSIDNIKNFLLNPKIIIVLRNPIDRAFSQYLHFTRDGRETLSFEKALKLENRRKELNWEWAWFYKDVGLYYNQVKAYLENFENVKIYLYDDLMNNRLGVVQDIYRFLEVDDNFVPESLNEKFNVSGIPKNRFLHEFLSKDSLVKKLIRPVVRTVMPDREKRQKLINKIMQKNLKKPKMKPETREYLKQFYKEDILKLQDLINRDLSHWLE